MTTRRVMPSRTRLNDLTQAPVDKLADFATRLTEFIADFMPVDDQYEPEHTEPEPGLIPHPVEPVVASPDPERLMCLCSSHTDDPYRRSGPEFWAYVKASQKSMASYGSLTASAHRDDSYTAWQASLILDEYDQTQADELLTELEA